MSTDRMLMVGGAVIGAYAGKILSGLLSRPPPDSEEVAEETPPPPQQSEFVNEAFGQPTRILSSTHELWLPMNRLHNDLRYDVEFDAFKLAVKALDDMLYFENTMHGSKAERFVNQVRFAEAARGAAMRQLDAIVQFGDRVIPSPTRRESLLEAIRHINETSDQVLSSMTSIMAVSIH